MWAGINRHSLAARVAGRIVLLALLSLFCIVTLDEESNAAGAAGHDVSIGDDDFQPGTVAVTTGDTVTWTNDGRKPHNVVALRGEWTSGRIDSGGTFHHTFLDAGDFSINARSTGRWPVR